MVDPVADRRSLNSPQLALRIAIFGGLALVLFAVIFFRLWYLQVLSGEEYLAQANDNRVRELRIQAPRGEIIDRNGRTLVTNRRAIVVTLDPARLPEEVRDQAAEWGKAVGERALKPEGRRGPQVPIPTNPSPELEARYQRLAATMDTTPKALHREVIEQLAQVPYADVRLKTDVPRAMLNYIAERKALFPGVRVDEIYLRKYPRKTLAAQMLGNVGEISPEQLEQARYRGVQQGTIVGRDGLEFQYDPYLRGKDGLRRVQVDSLGRPKGTPLREDRPTAGRTLKLSLDVGLQRAAQVAIGRVGGGLPGAAVALDPRNGEVLALASYPSFDPTEFTKPLTQRRYRELTSDSTGAPIFNRAIGGQYPVASTFKIVTAMAAMESGLIGPDDVVNDNGSFKLGPTTYKNAGDAIHGAVTLRRAMEVSSDVYFYRLGAQLNPLPGQQLQSWARKFGFGRRTGIDLPGETRGLVPDRAWRARLEKVELACRRKKKIPRSVNVFVAGARGCGISDMREWDAGDNVQLSIGQGDLQATPLQLATAYATLANGGRRVRAHLGLEINDRQGRAVQRIEPPGTTQVKMTEAYRLALMDGLRGASQGNAGTSTGVFADWPHDRFPVFGKTGTAERELREGKFDQSWYAAYVPDPKRPIVVVVTVEKGGFGAETAAPIARLMLAKWFGQPQVIVRAKKTAD